MVVIGGPPGGGKSTVFPVGGFGIDGFNVDDAAARLNRGSSRSIPPEIRAEANRQCEQFIAQHIQERKSFAVETTLRTDIVFHQAAAARANGFVVEFIYIALEDVEAAIERIAARADRGGHSAPVARIRSTYAASLSNFPRAIREFDRLEAYDNSEFQQRPRLVLEAAGGRVHFVAPDPPSWLRKALHGTEWEIP